MACVMLSACAGGDPVGPVCREPDCTEEQRQAAFERAVAELEGEGIEVTSPRDSARTHSPRFRGNAVV